MVHSVRLNKFILMVSNFNLWCVVGVNTITSNCEFAMIGLFSLSNEILFGIIEFAFHFQ